MMKLNREIKSSNDAINVSAGACIGEEVDKEKGMNVKRTVSNVPHFGLPASESDGAATDLLPSC